jgi:hypothetical protein
MDSTIQIIEQFTQAVTRLRKDLPEMLLPDLVQLERAFGELRKMNAEDNCEDANAPNYPSVPAPQSIDHKIRRLAKTLILVAKKRKGLWYLANCQNMLLSSENGLDEVEAFEWLQSFRRRFC